MMIPNLCQCTNLVRVQYQYDPLLELKESLSAISEGKLRCLGVLSKICIKFKQEAEFAIGAIFQKDL